MTPSSLRALAIGLLVGVALAWLLGGVGVYRTQTGRMGNVTVLYRINRVTGAVSLCVGAKACRAVPEVRP
jgi:hypothetical protein